MYNDKGILIENIYIMLSYAFQTLRKENFPKVEGIHFDNIQDLFAEILFYATSYQLKRGLFRNYQETCDDIPTIRGKLNIQNTIKNQCLNRKLINCEYDELSRNNIYNQILKTTLCWLAHNKIVQSERRKNLKRLLPIFEEIDTLSLSSIKWNTLVYQRNNKNYAILMNLCYFVLNDILLSDKNGTKKVIALSDEHMNRLYEHFVLEYYKRNYGNKLSEINAKQIKWNLDKDSPKEMIEFLPKMQTDITLRHNEKTLIIDTKYYASAFQKNAYKETFISGNLYQIFTYVKNYDTDNSGNVSGMLLYAKAQDDITPDCSFSFGGNKISVKTLDLSQKHDIIFKALNDIVSSHFEI